MDEDQIQILICSPTLWPGGVERLCETCGEIIYPNGANLAKVEAESIRMICLDCSFKYDNPVLSGVLTGGEVNRSESAVELFNRLKEFKGKA